MTPPHKTRPGFRGLIAASLAGVVLLTALGVWQLYRLQWKRNLIANIETGLELNPVSLADAEAGMENGYDVDWLKVTATGRFRHDLERHVYALRNKQPGWLVITPLVKQGDYVVLVNRGFVREDFKSHETRPETERGEVSVTGFVRVEPDQRNFFTPDTDMAANRWYWFDLYGITNSLPEDIGGSGDGPPARGMPFALQQAPFEAPQGYHGPRPAKVSPNLRNHHLGYAITWFSLAIVLAVMTILYIRKRARLG